MNDVWNAIKSGFSALGNEIIDLASNMGGWFADVGTWFGDLADDLGEWFGDIGTWLVELGGTIGGFFADIGKDIGGWFGSVFEWFGDIFDGLGGWFGDLFEDIGEVISYINPFSKNFLLYIAFVPDDGFMSGRLADTRHVLNDRFFFLTQMSDAMDSVLTRISEPTWKGFKAEIPLIKKEVTVISPVMVNEASGKIKAWVSGIIIVIMVLYLIKQGGRVIGAGKG